MSRRNRISPFGNIEFSDAKGSFMGNRGILVDATGQVRKTHAHKNWICCTLVSKTGTRVTFDAQDHYTPLFFWDEAVALAAGHRPCAECRNADCKAFKRAFVAATGDADESALKAAQIDARLHADRLEGKAKKTFRARLLDLPAACFFALADQPDLAYLWHGGRALPWSHHGYGPSLALDPDTIVEVLTPKLTVAILAAGYSPQLQLSPAPN